MFGRAEFAGLNGWRDIPNAAALPFRQSCDRDETAGIGNPSQLIELNWWLWAGESGVADEEKVAVKKALLLVAVLTFSLPCFAQVADRAPTRSPSSSNATRAVGTWARFDRAGYDAFDPGYVVGTSGSASDLSIARGPSITVYGASAAFVPSVAQGSSDWTFMQFGDPGTIGPAAFHSTPSLGAIARAAREAKSRQTKPEAEIRIKKDGNGALVAMPQKQ